MNVIDINADVGEGLENEASLLPLISSCNIACGGHAGSNATMESVVILALENQVKIGAHPSYPDRANFGRKSMPIGEKELLKSLSHQLEDFEKVLQAKKAKLHHIKPHGALYNDAANNHQIARVFLNAVQPYKNNTHLYLPHNSVVANLALEYGFSVNFEAFLDRNYSNDLKLVSRSMEKATIQKPTAVLAHLLTIAKQGKVLTIDNQFKKIQANTYCIHGDNPNVLQILMYLQKELPNHNLQLQKWNQNTQ
ncbi:5-oxoprolinase subunit PxpA [Croceivirga sp. JEA036]|uniref:5-oxoprolinase subunit PxpA n=1 Tax=Croceivirga sp. JEA036 TaxID=2721162 RepID=UPI00143BA5B9|nr:5-oxoprolinase subunit PxpA [Croceivirga sp. JEA036]NJB35772.1 5-oxoprolinase subunit PxpA [Croceivirga sp. JEA036]